MTRQADKIARVQSELNSQGIDAVVLGPGAHMHWVLGWHPHPDERVTLLVIGQTTACVVVPSVNADQFGAHTDLPMFKWRDEDGADAAVADAVATLSGQTVVAVDETMRADFALALLDAVPGATRRFAGDVVGRLRMTKDAEEIAALEASAAVNDAAMSAGFANVRAGQTEREAAQAIRDSFADAGANVAFVLCASGPNGAFPHHSTGSRVIEKGDAIVFDIGAGFEGWPSDMTRMAAVGHTPDGYDEVHAIVEAAVIAAMAAAKPGVAAHVVDDAARDVIRDAGYGDYFVHRTGHGLGLEVHEPPYLTATSQTVLEEGMVFSIEPGIYLPGRFGIRLEEIVVLRADGPQILSSLPRTIHIADA